MSDLDRDHKRFLNQIRREKIQEPSEGQHVDRCHYSKTGWAIWGSDGACTCTPAKAPPATQTRGES